MTAAWLALLVRSPLNTNDGARELTPGADCSARARQLSTPEKHGRKPVKNVHNSLLIGQDGYLNSSFQLPMLKSSKSGTKLREPNYKYGPRL